MPPKPDLATSGFSGFKDPLPPAGSSFVPKPELYTAVIMSLFPIHSQSFFPLLEKRFTLELIESRII